MTNNKEKYKWVSIEKITTPFNGHALIYIDFWWVANNNEEVLVYDEHYPQANLHSSIASKFMLRYEDLGATKIIKIPAAFMPDSASRY